MIEGGGSPAEINLRSCDIVNMGMAETVDTDVILVANIEIGGVFAQIYGTVALLDEADRKRIKGYIINKFRGDSSLLKPGIEALDKRFKAEGYDIPCLGVVPVADINIEEEDSLAKQKNIKKTYSEDKIRIGIIKNKQLANFTDFYCFEGYDDVELLYIERKEELVDFDMLILPGSKNTISDINTLKAKGLFEAIKKEAEKGTVIVGICGGLQMLGSKIYDKYAIEGDVQEIEGFNFFDYTTSLEKEKITCQTKIKTNKMDGFLKGMENCELEGYEIHQGRTDIKESIINKENIFATYLHGIFDNDDFRNEVINRLREKKGLAIKEYKNNFKKYKEEQFKLWAEVLKKSLDMENIYSILK